MTLEGVFFAGSVAFVALGLAFLFGVLRERALLRRSREEAEWMRKTYLRALEQLEHGKVPEVVAGLQTVGSLGDKESVFDLEMARRQWASEPEVLKQVDEAASRVVDREERRSGSHKTEARHAAPARL